MPQERKRREDTVPEIYMNGTDTDALPVYARPAYGKNPITDDPDDVLNTDSDLEDPFYGDAWPEYRL